MRQTAFLLATLLCGAATAGSAAPAWLVNLSGQPVLLVPDADLNCFNTYLTRTSDKGEAVRIELQKKDVIRIPDREAVRLEAKEGTGQGGLQASVALVLRDGEGHLILAKPMEFKVGTDGATRFTGAAKGFDDDKVRLQRTAGLLTALIILPLK